MTVWLAHLLGIIVGSVVVSIWYCIHTSFGTLKIDRSNPEKDVYRLAIDDLDKLSKKRYVRLKVDKNADLSQE